jgi:hypothetical protein
MDTEDNRLVNFYRIFAFPTLFIPEFPPPLPSPHYDSPYGTFPCRAGFSYLSSRRFYEGAQSQAHILTESCHSGLKTHQAGQCHHVMIRDCDWLSADLYITNFDITPF